MNVSNLSELELSTIETLIQDVIHTVGVAELNRFTAFALQSEGTVYILEYEGVLLGPGMERLSPAVISLFRRLKVLGVPVYLLTEQVRFVIIEAFGEDVFTGIVTCANSEAKADMVALIMHSHPGASMVCCGTEFLASVDALELQDFVYSVYEPQPGRPVRAHDMRTLLDTRRRVYPVTRSFVADLMLLVWIKAIWRSTQRNNNNSHSANP